VATGRILVIAPNSDFRKSLTFALEAEGYATAEATTVPSASAETYDAVVLDHKATRGRQQDVLDFCQQSQPVVLLAGDPQPWLAERVFRAVPTPILGQSLSNAVADAVRISQTAK
jgi:CheY-like chemotaxis protein